MTEEYKLFRHAVNCRYNLLAIRIRERLSVNSVCIRQCVRPVKSVHCSLFVLLLPDFSVNNVLCRQNWLNIPVSIILPKRIEILAILADFSYNVRPEGSA